MRVALMDEISTGLDSSTTWVGWINHANYEWYQRFSHLFWWTHSFDLMKTLKTVSSVMELTTVVSLLQPPPEVPWDNAVLFQPKMTDVLQYSVQVVALFDNVLMLESGRIIYHGPVASVMNHFSSLGYICPPRMDHADFLQVSRMPSFLFLCITIPNHGLTFLVSPSPSLPLFFLTFPKYR